MHTTLENALTHGYVHELTHTQHMHTFLYYFLNTHWSKVRVEPRLVIHIKLSGETMGSTHLRCETLKFQSFPCLNNPCLPYFLPAYNHFLSPVYLPGAQHANG